MGQQVIYLAVIVAIACADGIPGNEYHASQSHRLQNRMMEQQGQHLQQMVTDARVDLPQVNYGRLRTQVNVGEPEIANQNPAADRALSVEPSVGLAIPAVFDMGYLGDSRTTPGAEFASGISFENSRTDVARLETPFRETDINIPRPRFGTAVNGMPADLARVETPFRGTDINIPRPRFGTAVNGMPADLAFRVNAGIPIIGLGTANDFAFGRTGFDSVDARTSGIDMRVDDVGLVGRGIIPEYERLGIDSGPGVVAGIGFGNSEIGYGAFDSDAFVIGTGMIDGLDYVRYGY